MSRNIQRGIYNSGGRVQPPGSGRIVLINVRPKRRLGELLGGRSGELRLPWRERFDLQLSLPESQIA